MRPPGPGPDILGSMAQMLFQSKGEEFQVLLDDADLPRVEAAGGWFIRRDKKTNYVIRNVPTERGRRTEFLHRFLLGTATGVQVDHANRNGLDNRRENLRECAQSENRGNTARYRNNTSGFKGVSFHKPTGKWSAKVRKDKKDIWLGVFDSPQAAHEAYCTAAGALFGAFARFS